MPTYLEGTGGMEYETVLTISFVRQFAMMLLIPFAGSLSDRIGRKPVRRISLIGPIVMSVPMYMLMSQGVWGTLIGIDVLGVLYVLQLATISATFPAMFPTKVRFAGFAITYNVSTSLFGGTARCVNEALIEATGSPLVPASVILLSAQRLGAAQGFSGNPLSRVVVRLSRPAPRGRCPVRGPVAAGPLPCARGSRRRSTAERRPGTGPTGTAQVPG